MKIEELNRVIDHFAPSEKQKQKMFDRIISHEAKAKVKGKSSKILLITAIITLFSTTALAFNNTTFFKEIFGNSIYIVKDQILSPIASAEDDRFRLTLEGVFSDSFSSMLIVSVEALNEQSKYELEQTELQLNVRTVQLDIQASTVDGAKELKNYSTENKKYFSMLFVSVDQALKDDLQVHLTAGVSNLFVSVPTKSTIQSINIEVDGKHYKNADYTPQNILISPLSVVIIGIENVINYQIPNPNVILHFTNGTKIEVFNQKSGFGGSRFPEDGITTMSAQFEKIIDLQKIQFVIIDGIEYSIK